MSVLRIPVRVPKTLIAPTVTVLTAVLVNKDSMEMVQFVKVWYIEKDIIQLVTQAAWKKFPSSPNRSLNFDLPHTGGMVYLGGKAI